MSLTEQLRTIALSAAKEAGELLLHGRPHNMQVDTKSSETDVVTEMDRKCERLLVDRLLADRPDDGMIGEEGASRESSSGITWVIDPIDGTVCYMYRQPHWTVSIGAKDEQGGLVGVVHVPSVGETYIGIRGEGAVRIDAHGEHRLMRRDRPALGMSLVGTGFGYGSDRRRSQSITLTHVLPVVRDIRRMGAASLDICMVADGRLDAYYERGLSEWDYAGASVVATEAGVQIGGLPGVAAGPDLFIAAPPGLFDELTALLASAGAAAD